MPRTCLPTRLAGRRTAEREVGPSGLATVYPVWFTEPRQRLQRR